MALKTEHTSTIHLVRATKFIRRMKGGSQACLLECSDHCLYVTKMRGNPQGMNVLANEFVGTAMARSVGLRVPASAMIELSDSFIDNNPDLFFQLPKEDRRPTAGLHFGSAFIQASDGLSRVLDRLTYSQQVLLKDGSAFTGISMLDLLAELADTRQMVFSRRPNEQSFRSTFIDFGHYYRGPNWERGSPKSGPIKYSVSAFARLWQNQAIVDNWLVKFQRHLPQALSDALSTVPDEWHKGDVAAMRSHYQRRIQEFPKIVTYYLARRSAYSVFPSLLNERKAHQ